MDVIFITGESKTGKTAIACEMARKMKLAYFVSGGTKDPFQAYKGQPCIILDDLRPNEHHISDLLRMTDNNTASLVNARYMNKIINEARFMIITSVLPIEEFYKTALQSEENLALQLCRRVFGYMKVTKKEAIFYAFNYEKLVYEEKFKLPNKITELEKANEKNQGKRIEYMKNIMKGVSKGLESMAENLEDYIEPENRED